MLDASSRASRSAERPALGCGTIAAAAPRVDGKFLAVGGARFLVKGVSYGTFAPGPAGDHFPALGRVAEDFGAMAAAAINTVRVYTPPGEPVMDEAARAGLRVIVGVPWAQHVAFLDEGRHGREARRQVVAHVRRLASHPAALLFAVGNEIPPSVVRWHGRERVARFLADLYRAAKDAAPDALLTYVNFPPTEFLDLAPFDVYSANVYLHRAADLRAYLRRLQHVAGNAPLLLAEAGADSLREGEARQAEITAMHLREAFAAGCCGAVAYAWTDEWWRGGQQVTDWAFGLVDRERRPKPALAAVSQAFVEAPFPLEARRHWPRVSVVVCAYNAADTLQDCLTSLGALTYPDVEVIVVNDGSTDRTGEIASSHPLARVVTVPNGGLSAARNVGLAHASGDIVAYTDADVRVDPDWLTYLVQPFLDSDVVGCGGPNVVPVDDRLTAQCVARAPGGPTHVLLDDRTAEHVPGCNMAFRRAALEAVGGFNAIYLRAGDDVDLCWRLQARGWRIGFAPAALVWHHHRASARAYWRQQVGYGEGEIWLRHQHPDKFSGGHMLWHGRIYSPLPFVRALTRLRMNTGVWGLAPFPSVYHTGADPWSYVPHAAPWYVTTALLLLAGAIVLGAGHSSAGWMLALAGALGLVTTVARCLRYAARSDLRLIAGLSRRRAVRLRATIAWLHFIQPLARLRGRIRGLLEPPAIPAGASAIPAATARPVPGPRAVWTALRLLAGASLEDRAWSERWLGVDDFLHRAIDSLRLARLFRVIDIADGWEQRHDVSVALGRWAWFDVAALIEEHAQGRVLVRCRIGLRPSALTVVVAVLAFAGIFTAALAGNSPRWAIAALGAMLVGVATLAVVTYRTAAALAGLRGVIRHTLEVAGATAIEPHRETIRFSPDLALWRYAARSALASLVVVGFFLGSSLLVRDAVVTTARQFDRQLPAPTAAPAPEPAVPWVGLAVAPNGDLYLADARQDTLRRVSTRASAGFDVLAPITMRPAVPTTRLDTPGGVAVAPAGDLFIADTEAHRVFRVDRVSGSAVVVAGMGEAGSAGDGGPATRAMLNQPAAVAVDRQGDLYIVDTGNHRVRKVSRKTGIITTIAGGGTISESDPATEVGDGAAATQAILFFPTDLAVAPNRDLYIADTGHHRIRRVEAATGRITTVAGDGTAGATGDGGPAAAARLSSPTGIALVARRGQVTLYVADHSNGRVRVITPDGLIGSLALPNATKIGSPARVAYHPKGYLYVAGQGQDPLTAVSLTDQPRAKAPRPAVAAPPRRAM